jgi:hypothetical protein
MPEEEPNILERIFSGIGMSKETTKTFKFGGVVGKLAIISVGGIVGVIGVAKYTTGVPQLVSILSVLAATLIVIRWTLNYAEKHPISATLEGAEIILWQQQRMLLGAKNLNPPSNSLVISDPEGTPPQAIVPFGDDL